MGRDTTRKPLGVSAGRRREAGADKVSLRMWMDRDDRMRSMRMNGRMRGGPRRRHVMLRLVGAGGGRRDDRQSDDGAGEEAHSLVHRRSPDSKPRSAESYAPFRFSSIS
jgi:hypothetical protein